MEEIAGFHWADYLVFAVFLLISLGIGVYYGLFADKKKEASTDEFLMGRGMSIAPVALAILSSFLSAILILGTPAEVYTRGAMYYLYVIGMMGAIAMATVLFVPLLYPLRLTSSYEYLELRFKSKLAKYTGTLILFTTQVLYMGIALYSPSTALEAVTGFPVWAAIIVGGVVSMIYTAVGGMKASVWASAFQTVVMAAGVIAVVVKGVIDVGGFDVMWELNEKAGRLDVWEFDTDPLIRHSFWGLTVGGMVGWLSTYGVNQASVQRYSSLPTLNKARATVLLNIPGILIFMTICVLSGMAIFAYYEQVGCDPLAAGIIDNPNQLIAYFVMDRLAIPGIPGLFLACLFSGSLSSVSASLAALAAVTWEDVLKGFLDHLSDVTKLLITKALVLIYGAVAIGMGFMAATLGGTVLQASLSFTGASGGPLLGLFLLGGLFPCANWWGAVFGGVIGLAIPLWISTGAYSIDIYDPYLPTTTENCNMTLPPAANITGLPPDEITGINRLYLMSYLWYSAIGAAICVVLGLLVSCVTGFMDPNEEVEPKYMLPFFDRLFCCLPNKSLHILRCKVDIPSPQEILKEQEALKIEAMKQRLSNEMPMTQVDETEKQGVENPALDELPTYTDTVYEDDTRVVNGIQSNLDTTKF